MARGVELEWQFVVRDADAFARWLGVHVAPPWSLTDATVRSHVDAYYDTDDWHLWSAGWALRIRRGSLRNEATLKALSRARRGGLARRREIDAVVRDARPSALATDAGRVGSRVRRLAYGAPLRRLFAIHTRRKTFVLRHDGRAVAELALDRTRVVARGGRCRRFARFEVEVKAGAPAVVARFVATLRRRRHLTVAPRSKFEEGLRTARLAPPRR